MGKHNVFDELLNSEFRWPKMEDQPFVASDEFMANAVVADDESTRLVLMMEGYKKAGDLMVKQATDCRADRDFLVFPIIFNYRQFLELSLKYLISNYGPTVDIKPNWRSHDLAELWKEFLELLDGYGTSDPDEVDPVVGKIIAEFSKIDPGSYSYRYPVDRNGNPIPIEYTDLHLPTLADVLNGVAGYFTGCDGYLSELKDAY